MFIEIKLKPIKNEDLTCYINYKHIVKINERNLNLNDNPNSNSKKVTVIHLVTGEIIETFENKHLLMNRIYDKEYENEFVE